MPQGRHRAGSGPRLAVIITVAVLALLAVAGGTLAWQATLDPPPTLAAVDTGQPEWSVPDQTNGSDQVPAVAEPLPPAFPADTGVLLIGDSLAVGIAETLGEALFGRELLVEAEEGRSTPSSVALVADHAASTPPIWVVSLGTNDNPEEFADDARELVQLAGRERCVLWFDVHRPDTEVEINSVLTQLESENTNVELMEWQALATAHPDWFTIDDIHPDTPGYEQRALLAANEIARTCTRS